MSRRRQGFEYLDFAPKLLRHFATQRLFRGFTGFLLPSRKFPAKAKVFVGRALSDKDPTFPLDQGADDGKSGDRWVGHVRS